MPHHPKQKPKEIKEKPLFQAPNLTSDKITKLNKKPDAKIRVFDSDEKLPAREYRERTQEMGGPNMETPLEGNAFTKAMADNDGNYEAAKKQLEGSDSPNTMISTGVAGMDPMTGMPQANQLAPSPINPRALGSMQSQIPSITGQPVAGAYDRVMPAPAQTGLAAPLQHKMKQMHIHPTEFTGKIKTKPDGQEYSLIEPDGNQKVPDTLKPKGLKFRKGIVKDGYLEGSLDLPAIKTGRKTFTLNQ